jgi:hypothetical protein
VLLQIVQKILQEQAGGKSPSQSIVNIAVQNATGGGRNVNDEIALAAQIIAKESPGIPVRSIESIIIQMALEISRAQGKAITGQTIFEIASQIKQNPNGVLTQAILQLAKQDTHDNGKTGQTVNVIKKAVQATDDPKKANEERDRVDRDREVLSGILPPAAQPAAPVATVIAPKTLPLLTIGDIWGRGVAQLSGNSVVGPFVKEIVNSYAQSVLGPLGPQVLGGLTKVLGDALTNYFVLRTANNMEGPQALQTLQNLRADIQDDPDALQRLERMVQPNQSGNDTSASQSLDLMSDKLVAGIDPSVAIEETPLPESGITFVIDQMIGAEQFSRGELEVKSLPPDYANITDFVAGGPEGTTFDSENNSTDVQFESEQPFIQEPSTLEVSPFIPGFGLTSQPELFDEQITSLPPEEPITTTQRTSTLDECLENPELCYEPTQQQSAGEDTDIEYSDISDENTAPGYFDEDIGGYQQEEQDYSEENSGEEDDYEEIGGYNAAEENYSEEEDSGDEEDDYEEIGGYQEEEEQYSEDEVEEEDGGEEEEESVEYYEE